MTYYVVGRGRVISERWFCSRGRSDHRRPWGVKYFFLVRGRSPGSGRPVTPTPKIHIRESLGLVLQRAEDLCDNGGTTTLEFPKNVPTFEKRVSLNQRLQHGPVGSGAVQTTNSAVGHPGRWGPPPPRVWRGGHSPSSAKANMTHSPPGAKNFGSQMVQNVTLAPFRAKIGEKCQSIRMPRTERLILIFGGVPTWGPFKNPWQLWGLKLGYTPYTTLMTPHIHHNVFA